MITGISIMILAVLHADFGDAYWLMGANNILTTQRLDPVVYPNMVSTHVHSVLGGSNFGINASSDNLRRSACTSIPIPQDKSNYWFPQLYFQWQNGTFTSVNGNAVIEKSGYTKPFPDDFRMISGDPNLRTFDASSFAQQAVTYLCLDFSKTSGKFNELPKGRCRSGIRSQINFPSCWDGKNSDSPDHKSHVAFLSTGPDNGTCNDPNFPVTIPRIFLEVYWNTPIFDVFRPRAMVPDQPFVFSNGDPTGYGYHADFINGWEPGVLQRAVNECNCNPYGDPTCCAAQQIFTIDQNTNCYITDTVDEATTGILAALPGNNPVQAGCYEEYFETSTPALLSPIFVYNEMGDLLPPKGSIFIPSTTRNVTQTARGTCIRNWGAVSYKLDFVLVNMMALGLLYGVFFV
ncbi:hypothetical protein Hypma_009210 [Hypsizygus marmoreus]|uniref:DUF1996 domain-containing protein n=1 Tax=Hypsizygus marmoreus TaxID=39966 RepID=A0A369JMR5_HYPMA|nr:hypothetical protein Hypma_009210 [Hypsizygus marmoreus]